MFLKSIQLTQFKNYQSQHIDFHEKFVCITGKNGMGKTNLLDAIYYTSLTRGMQTNSDKLLIKKGEDFFRLEASYTKEDSSTLSFVSTYQAKTKKIWVNEVLVEKIQNHIGSIPIVVTNPYDVEIALEGSEVRRKYIDSTISQVDKAYLNTLIQYNKVLANRNNSLKDMSKRGSFDELLLDTYDDQLIPLAESIHEKRVQFMNEIQPVFQHYYQLISNDAEHTAFTYRSSQVNASYAEQLKESRSKDKILARTTIGPHKDDLVFTLEDNRLKTFGSQGQLKSFILALKLTQHAFLFQEKKEPPILLLDDIFDKLDNDRVFQLMELLSQDSFKQIFITDTELTRVKSIMDKAALPYQSIQVQNGEIQ